MALLAEGWLMSGHWGWHILLTVALDMMRKITVLVLAAGKLKFRLLIGVPSSCWLWHYLWLFNL
nr:MULTISPECIES: hypothetical protein [Acinetobacter]